MKQFRDMIGCLVLVLMCGASYGEVVATARSPKGEFPEFRVELGALGQPVAVANFAGLADGSQAWVDSEDGALLGVEVKAGAAGTEDFRHLRWFGENAAKGTFTGIVLYGGKEVLRFGEGYYAVPLGALGS